MKAVLVIDVPECCWECHLCDLRWAGVDQYLDRCYAQCMPCGRESVKEYCLNTLLDANRINMNRAKKPDWCPLKPMPQMKFYAGVHSDFARGWMACLREIEK